MAAVARERLETGVLFVGAGPAALSAAIRLVDLCRERGGSAATSGPVAGPNHPSVARSRLFTLVSAFWLPPARSGRASLSCECGTGAAEALKAKKAMTEATAVRGFISDPNRARDC